MGALHRGHVALIEEAKRHADFIVTTVFVNPTQFGPNEDFARYPRTLDADREKAESAGAAGVFAPPPDAMYPPGDETRVHVGATAAALCGAHRPGHFEGVTTIVAKLFMLAGPCTAVFGRKDFQQLAVVRRMTTDLLMPVEIVGLRTVREVDGLALSSRNAYMTAAMRERALAIPRGLSRAVHAYEAGERDPVAIAAIAREEIARVATSIDYVDVADADTIRVLGGDERIVTRSVLAIAARLGGGDEPSVRLIDNVVLGEDPAPIADFVRG
jgi:pantoate--beta-alanine ligase